jgi:hypothetical protein
LDILVSGYSEALGLAEQLLLASVLKVRICPSKPNRDRIERGDIYGLTVVDQTKKLSGSGLCVRGHWR